MTIWLHGNFDSSTWFPLRDQFDHLCVELGGPADVMLVQIDDGASGRTRLVASLPNETYARLFQGFSEISSADLPARASSLIVGQLSEAEKFFKFPEYRANA